VHLHLEPAGGISGDMFIGAILDCWPELVRDLPVIFTRMGLSDNVTASNTPHRDHTLSGSRFTVKLKQAAHHHSDDHDDIHHHTSFRDIRKMLELSGLATGVTSRAIDIFARLAHAEGRAHGCPPDEVSFHEVGAWDSIADITFAAYLIETLAADSWSVSAIPLGSGRVNSQHGTLPVPAPATHFLLEGFTVFDDGLIGERVTPTGAAILNHLAPCFGAPSHPARLIRSGIGFGTRELKGLSNILRITEFEPVSREAGAEELTVIAFEVDDQTPEDLAVGLENLRRENSVIDVTQSMVIGKKGRQVMQVQLLCPPEHEREVMDHCFRETTTLGIRHHRVHRRVLSRSESCHDGIRVKTATRPGAMTAKADIDDVADRFTTHTARVSARAQAEAAVIDAGEFNDARYRENPLDRCYFCKTNLYAGIASSTSLPILSGTNLDDLDDFRPGLNAAREFDVRHPFVEAGIIKADVRRIARELDLTDLSELPAAPCLSSRVETGIRIEAADLNMIDWVENFLSGHLGAVALRCRIRKDGLCIEIDGSVLTAISKPEIDGMVGNIQKTFLPPGYAVSVAPYVRGSAFIGDKNSV